MDEELKEKIRDLNNKPLEYWWKNKHGKVAEIMNREWKNTSKSPYFSNGLDSAVGD